jgi:hypothetical protein
MVLFLGDLLTCVHLVNPNSVASFKKLSLYYTNVLYLNLKVSF